MHKHTYTYTRRKQSKHELLDAHRHTHRHTHTHTHTHTAHASTQTHLLNKRGSFELISKHRVDCPQILLAVIYYLANIVNLCTHETKTCPHHTTCTQHPLCFTAIHTHTHICLCQLSPCTCIWTLPQTWTYWQTQHV